MRILFVYSMLLKFVTFSHYYVSEHFVHVSDGFPKEMFE